MDNPDQLPELDGNVLDLSADPEIAELEREFTRKVRGVLVRRAREGQELLKAQEQLDQLEQEIADLFTEFLAEEAKRVAAQVQAKR